MLIECSDLQQALINIAELRKSYKTIVALSQNKPVKKKVEQPKTFRVRLGGLAPNRSLNVSGRAYDLEEVRSEITKAIKRGWYVHADGWHLYETICGRVVDFFVVGSGKAQYFEIEIAPCGPSQQTLVDMMSSRMANTLHFFAGAVAYTDEKDITHVEDLISINMQFTFDDGGYGMSLVGERMHKHHDLIKYADGMYGPDGYEIVLGDGKYRIKSR